MRLKFKKVEVSRITEEQKKAMTIESGPVLTKGVEAGIAATIYTVDSFENGIAFGSQRWGGTGDPRDHYSLRLESEELVNLRGRYLIHRNNGLAELKRHLSRLSDSGRLARSTIIFGVTSDPFYPFEGKFDASMRFLELFMTFTPGLLIVQTRSPLLVIALPVIRKLGSRLQVTVPIESFDEGMVRRFSPGLSRIEERVKMVRALRRFSAQVTLQVAPVLPYGDWRNDAEPFARFLDENGDRIHLAPLQDGSPLAARRMKSSALAKRLTESRMFHWLRPDAVAPVRQCLESICPDKLVCAPWTHLEDKQLDIFAA